MENKNCYQCGSNSTVLDGGQWVCFQHINPCKCKRNHDSNHDWDFNQSRGYADAHTIEGMERQLVELDAKELHTMHLSKRAGRTDLLKWVNLKKEGK